MIEVTGGIEFMEEIPRDELVRLRILEEKVKMLQRFLEMQSVDEEVIRMIFNWPTDEESTIEVLEKKIPIDSVTVCQMYKDGRTPKQIADMSGLDYDRIRKILRDAGLLGSASYA